MGVFALVLIKITKNLQDRIQVVKNKMEKKLPTLPVKLSDELETNIFLRCDDERIKNNLKMSNSSKFEVFKKLRNLKDKF